MEHVGQRSSAVQAAVAAQTAPAGMQLASLDNSMAADAQTALVKPNYNASSQSVSQAKKASQGVNAAEKGVKPAPGSHSASKAAAFAAKVQKAKAPTPSSLKVKSASK
jgi:hypothetical protein